VIGGEYPAGPAKQLIAQILGFAQLGLLLFIFMGDTILRTLGIEPPEFLKKIQENKWAWVIGTWFIGGQLQAGLLSSGAFEIYVNDVLEYSKIDSGRMPDMQIIDTLLQKYNINV
jgi:hypothetical protein